MKKNHIIYNHIKYRFSGWVQRRSQNDKVVS